MYTCVTGKKREGAKDFKEGGYLYIYETKKNKEEGKIGECFVYLCDREEKRGSEGF